jgi:hypothetical protein
MPLKTLTRPSAEAVPSTGPAVVLTCAAAPAAVAGNAADADRFAVVGEGVVFEPGCSLDVV